MAAGSLAEEDLEAVMQIVDLLRRNPTWWFNAGQIESRTGIPSCKVPHIMRKLRNKGIVEIRTLERELATNRYRIRQGNGGGHYKRPLDINMLKETSRKQPSDAVPERRTDAVPIQFPEETP